MDLLHRHPARVFTVPNETAYGVLAARKFEANEPILPYSGKLLPNHEPPEDSCYVYLLPHDDLPGYSMRAPPLCIDPLKQENEARFINDQWAPPGMEHACANVRAEVVWDVDESIPHLIIMASRTIHAGEELLLDYGKGYWRHTHPQLMVRHIPHPTRPAPSEFEPSTHLKSNRSRIFNLSMPLTSRAPTFSRWHTRNTTTTHRKKSSGYGRSINPNWSARARERERL